MPAPQDNSNAQTHGIRRFLTSGRLPRGCSYIRNCVDAFRQAMEDEVAAKNDGSIGLMQAALINSAVRHETRAQLLHRWLWKSEQDGETDLSLKDRAAYTREISTATDLRDKALRAVLGTEAEADKFLEEYDAAAAASGVDEGGRCDEPDAGNSDSTPDQD